jgi:hypothetical protein
MPDLRSQDSVTHSFHHLKEKASILPLAQQKEIGRHKNVLPGDKLIDCADAAEKLYILIAHYVKHLSPQQQTARYDDYQQNPAYFFHSILRISIRCFQDNMSILNRG